MNILIVDDNKHNRYILEAWLKKNGYQVTSTVNGAEALEKLHTQDFDLIIADILMPVMDGWKLCQKVKSDNKLKDIPVVFFTGTYTDEKDEELALKCGVEKFIRKPIKEEKFIKSIKEVIENVKNNEIKPQALVREEDKDVLKLYNTRIVKKLEKKMLSLKKEIAERKKTEKKLKESEHRYRLLAETAGDIILVHDMEGKIVYINEAGVKISGYSREEINNMSLYEIICPEYLDELKERCGSLIAGDEDVYRHETEIFNQQGERISLEITSSALIEEDKIKEILIIARDITSRKRMEDALQRLDKLESVGVLAGGIAHDFNNLLTVILGNIQLARMSKTNPSVTERLEEVESASMQAKNLTQRLLTFSKGGAPVKKEASISELLKETTEFVLSGSNVRSEFNIDDDIWLAEIDTGQISQVVQNLVTNANQAMPNGGVIRVKAENLDISDRDSLPLKEGRYIKVSISDEGVGISEKNLPKIFDPYFSTKDKGTDKGTGLGLAVCHSIIEKHGGHITVESYVDVGTTFYFYLPASTKQETEDVTVKEEPEVGKGKILLMDDEETVRKVAKELLRHLDYEVELACDGEEVLSLYKQHYESGSPFDAVILDLTVRGGMGGEETIKRLLEIDPKVKAFVSSGYSNNPIMSNYEQYGFTKAIAKPYNIKQLSDTLCSLY